ncbi:MAG: eukaryotic-like serine/threonine-protein kinase [Verrucomicrobiota bacterium]
MNADRWQKLKSILAEALEQETPSARSVVIGRSCADDADLLHEIESLMAEADQTDSFEECAENLAIAVPQEDASEIGRRVGAYIIIREIGHGGMGTVYLAARADGYFEKQVAIKVLNRGAATEDVVRRFRAEREVLAKLDHPNIARLMDAGTMDDGRPYFVMEYIDGVPIIRFVEEKGLAFQERLDLFLKVSAAVEAAHRNSVIHRDLKPNNILVNHEGEPKLLDFGIAKVIGTETNPLEITSFRQQRLTPMSASPEQVRGEPITVLSDIYALGVVLYEMLTGVRPHRFETSHPSDEELIEVVCNQLPSLPSLAVKDRERQRQLHGDLDAILVRALQKDPDLRYSSVGEFAQDIRRHLAGRPVQARGNKLGYRVTTALLHNWKVQIASAAAMLCLIAVALAFALRSHLNKIQAGSVLRAGEKTSIAVLPFDSPTPDKENNYFADGVQDAILTNLANVSALKVISRSSVAEYQGKEKNASEIGRALGVSYVLEGHVQKTSDHVRIDAHLIDTRTSATVWAQQYDRALEDLFGVESDVAQAIVSQLKGKLSTDERAAIENRPTRDMLAYDLYLRARESFFQDNCERAIHLLEQVIARDPQFALAYSSLAEGHLYMYRFMADQTPDRLDRAKKAADTALQLAPKLPQSHLAEAQYCYYGLRDYGRALAELNTARSLGGEQAEFIDLSALIERRLGRWNDAIRDGERAAELDPQNPFVVNELVESYLAVRRFADADRTADKAIKAAVSRSGQLWTLRTEALLGMGRIDEARTVIDSSPEGMTRMYEQVWVALYARDFAHASKVLSEAAPREKQSHNVPLLEAMIARAQGDPSRARSLFQIARDRILVKLGERPNDPSLFSDLSLADAGLGRKETAIEEATKAVELCPLWRDAIDGATYQAMRGMVYAWIGDRNAAMAELEKVVKLPRGPHWGELRYSPLWDDLRSDSRFDPLMTHAALPPVYN